MARVMLLLLLFSGLTASDGPGALRTSASYLHESVSAGCRLREPAPPDAAGESERARWTEPSPVRFGGAPRSPVPFLMSLKGRRLSSAATTGQAAARWTPALVR